METEIEQTPVQGLGLGVGADLVKFQSHVGEVASQVWDGASAYVHHGGAGVADPHQSASPLGQLRRLGHRSV